MRDPDLLVAALQELGFTAAQIERHETAQPLLGYLGDRRPERAHVIVRRQHVGPNANDLGFEIGPDGRIVAHISEFDQRHGRKLNAAWLGKLGQRYQYRTAIRECERLRRPYTVEEQQDGSLHIRVRGYR